MRPSARLRAVVTGAVLVAASCGPVGPSDPGAISIHVEDVVRFWAVADPLLEAVEAGTADAAVLTRAGDALQVEYLDAGSPTLDRFARRMGLTGHGLAQAVAADPFRYRAVRDASRELTASPQRMEGAVRELAARLDSLYPDAVFPELYFLVADGRSGGTVFSKSLAVAVELAATEDDLLQLAAHELAHAQQPRRSNRTVLSRALREGAADWVAERLTGTPVRSRAYAWGYTHEPEVWERFRAAANTDATAAWFGPARSSQAPGSLGYFMGYRIVDSFAERMQASTPLPPGRLVERVLRWTDARSFVAESGYRPGPVGQIRSGARRAMGLHSPGDTLSPSRIAGLRLRANVTAPDGSVFSNEVLSSPDGAGLLRQFDGASGWTDTGQAPALTAAAGPRFTWARDGSGRTVTDDLTRGFVRGHELHALALFPETRLFEPHFLGVVQRGSGSGAGSHRSHLAVRWKVNRTDSLVLYYRATDTLPVGADLLWVEPAVEVRFSDWDRRPDDPAESGGGGPSLFRAATFTQGAEVFHYRYDTIEVAPLPADAFTRPREEGP